MRCARSVAFRHERSMTEDRQPSSTLLSWGLALASRVSEDLTDFCSILEVCCGFEGFIARFAVPGVPQKAKTTLDSLDLHWKRGAPHYTLNPTKTSVADSAYKMPNTSLCWYGSVDLGNKFNRLQRPIFRVHMWDLRREDGLRTYCGRDSGLVTLQQNRGL